MGGFNGTVGQINLTDNTYASGDQFFMICYVPEPSGIALLGLGAIGLGNRRFSRRRMPR